MKCLDGFVQSNIMRGKGRFGYRKMPCISVFVERTIFIAIENVCPYIEYNT